LPLLGSDERFMVWYMWRHIPVDGAKGAAGA
jgi:hypothetical protein